LKLKLRYLLFPNRLPIAIVRFVERSLGVSDSAIDVIPFGGQHRQPVIYVAGAGDLQAECLEALPVAAELSARVPELTIRGNVPTLGIRKGSCGRRIAQQDSEKLTLNIAIPERLWAILRDENKVVHQ
jgi:hypothetical protein